MIYEHSSNIVHGAITDTFSPEAFRHAELFYEEIRHFSTDVKRITENTDFTYEQILMVKHYLFIDKHYLESGQEPRHFDACFEIAESWRRLMSKHDEIEPHDILLIKHELSKIDLVNKGFTQEDAHNISNKLYNYADACDVFYDSLNMNPHATTINAGAIRRILDRHTH